MGTPEIAVHSLDVLNKSKHQVAAVITVPDKPAGRGRKPTQSAVKIYAQKNNLKVLQPDNLKNNDFLEELKSFDADLFVVLAFRMLPKVVWDMPKYGTINMHASLLPNYRGAAPINWALINGETKTGVTTFFIDEKIDTGKIIFREEIDIKNEDNAGTLHDKIMFAGGDILIKTLDAIENNDYKKTDQADFIIKQADLKLAPKIFKTDCKINWNKGCRELFNFIRGLNPYPGAWTKIIKNEKELMLKIFDVEIVRSDYNKNQKEIIVDNNSFMIVCSDGMIKVNSLQLQGKKKMNSVDFIRGFNLSDCQIV